MQWYRPARGLVYTDTTRDGMLLGPNLAGLKTCLETFGGPVYVSGGVSSLGRDSSRISTAPNADWSLNSTAIAMVMRVRRCVISRGRK